MGRRRDIDQSFPSLSSKRNFITLKLKMMIPDIESKEEAITHDKSRQKVV